MVRPRWQSAKPTASRRFWLRWDRAIATIAAVNLAWVVFDALRATAQLLVAANPLSPSHAWHRRSTALAAGRHQGLRPGERHRASPRHCVLHQAFSATGSDRCISGINSPAARQLRLEMVVKNSQLIDENPFVASNKTGSLEKLKSRLRARAGMDSAKQSAAHLLGESYLTPDNWRTKNVFGRRTSCLSPPRTTGVELMRTGNRSTCPGGLIFLFRSSSCWTSAYGRFVSNDASRDCLAGRPVAPLDRSATADPVLEIAAGCAGDRAFVQHSHDPAGAPAGAVSRGWWRSWPLNCSK